jgi:hypothetical protein
MDIRRLAVDFIVVFEDGSRGPDGDVVQERNCFSCFVFEANGILQLEGLCCIFIQRWDPLAPSLSCYPGEGSLPMSGMSPDRIRTVGDFDVVIWRLKTTTPTYQKFGSICSMFCSLAEVKRPCSGWQIVSDIV